MLRRSRWSRRPRMHRMHRSGLGRILPGSERVRAGYQQQALACSTDVSPQSAEWAAPRLDILCGALSVSCGADVSREWSPAQLEVRNNTVCFSWRLPSAVWGGACRVSLSVTRLTASLLSMLLSRRPPPPPRAATPTRGLCL
jgi:hypothetical protein